MKKVIFFFGVVILGLTFTSVASNAGNGGYFVGSSSEGLVVPKLDLGRINTGIFEKGKEEEVVVIEEVVEIALKRPRRYVVDKGDCLWKIAEKVYGNGFLWGKLFKANRSKIKDPNLIYPGQIFNIP